MPERVFITGATGVIGRRVVPALVRRGVRVTAVGRSDMKRRTLENMGATAVTPPIDDRGRISRRDAATVLAGHDAVINLATHMPPSTTRMLLPWEWRENDRVRREDSVALAGAAMDAGVHRFIQESFAPVYADHGDRWIGEWLPLSPARTTRSVLDAERAAARFTTNAGAGVVLRFASLYGPDPILGEMIKAVRKGWSPLPGSPSAYWSSLAQDDAATAVVAALDSSVPAGVYNVADDEPLVRAEWVAVLANAVDAPTPNFPPRWATNLAGSGVRLLSRSQRISNDAFKCASGWTPLWSSAREGLPRAVARWLAGQTVEGFRRSA